MCKKIILILLLLCVSSCYLWAADLSKKITLQKNGATFTEICSDLSNQTGIAIKAGETDEDWRVYDRKAIISVKDITLQELLESICSVFNFTCIDKGGTLYLIQTEDQYKEESELVLSNVKKEMQSAVDRKNKGISDIIRYSRDTNYGNYKDTCPYGYLLGKGEFGKSLAAVLENEELKSLILDPAVNKFNYNRLGKDTQELLYNLAKNYKELYPPVDIDKIFAEKNNILVIFNRPNPEGDVTLERETILGRITVTSQKERVDGNEKLLLTCEIPILYPENPYTNVVGTAIIDYQAKKAESKINDELSSRLKALKTMDAQQGDPKNINISDPAFSKSVNLVSVLGRSGVTYGETLLEISRVGNINIVSDCFYRTPYNLVSKEMTATEYLKILYAVFGISADYTDKILEVKDDLWFMKRAGEVPSVWVDYWRLHSENTQGYTLDDMIDMANLTDLQIEYELTLSPKLNRKSESDGIIVDTKEVILKKNALRFLGSLNTDQLNKLTNDGKFDKAGEISAYELTDAQWELLESAFQEADTSFVKQKKSSQLIIFESYAGRFAEYNLEFQPDLSGEKHTITIIANQIDTIRKGGRKSITL